MDGKDRCIRFDWAIRRLLRDKVNSGILEGFLTVLLNKEIHILDILENEGNFNRIDVKVRDNVDDMIIIEVRIIQMLHYYERILYGESKVITEHIELGHIYSEVKKVYSISVLYFDIGKGDDYLYHGQNIFTGVHTGDFLQVTSKEKDALVRRLPSEIFPEYFLIRVNEFDKVAVTPLEEWIDYLKSGYIRPDTKAPGLEEARQKLIYYNMDAAEREAYDRHIDAIMIQNDVLSTAKLEGLAEGLVEGETRERFKMAGQALKMGMSVEDIVKLTGLTREEIEKL